jgi:WD40 repeat protein
VATLRGATSNVFATAFVDHRGDGDLLAGGNDSDIWHYEAGGRTATVYSVHTRKVLRLSVNPRMSDVFLSCSADGTIRQIDLRVHYPGLIARSVSLSDVSADTGDDDGDAVAP